MNLEDAVVIANLALEFLKVLVWPVIVLVLALMFKQPISQLLRKIKRIGFAGGTLDAEADEASSEVDEIRLSGNAKKERSTRAEPGGHQPLAEGEPDRKAEEENHAPVTPSVPIEVTLSAGGRETQPQSETLSDRLLSSYERIISSEFSSLTDGQFYENVRQQAVSSPSSAVREAYQRVRLNARKVMVVRRPNTPILGSRSLSGVFESMAQERLIPNSAVEPARRLDRIYHANRSSEELSVSGALSFIDAAQKLDKLLSEVRAFSPRSERDRKEFVTHYIEKLIQRWKLTDFVSVRLTAAAIIVRVQGIESAGDADAMIADFIEKLRTVAEDVGAEVEVHFDDQKIPLNS